VAPRDASARSTGDSSTRSLATDAVRHRWGGGNRLGGESL